MRFRILPLLSGLFLVLASPFAGNAQTNGIFADIETSLGNFTCSLDFTNAPMTVANFVGLAEGERNWLNLEIGKIERRPFYDGIIFHRVITNFMNQTGSPMGDGSDGPGYSFPDEVTTNALHDAPGVLSMANSGLNSNGSQFFVTVTNTPWLDLLHTVFGRVTEGMGVVHTINSVAVDGSSKPLTDVVINHIAIRRVGAVAQAFDIHAHNVPEVLPAEAEIVRSGAGLDLLLTRERDHEYWQYTSTNLATWTSERMGLYIDDPPAGNLAIDPEVVATPQHCFVFPAIDYPGPLYTPPAITNRLLTLLLSGQILILNLDGTGTGTWELTDSVGTPQGSGNISSTEWDQFAYRGVLLIFYDTLAPMRLHFAYGDATSGDYRGTVYTASPFSISGPFISSGP